MWTPRAGTGTTTSARRGARRGSDEPGGVVSLAELLAESEPDLTERQLLQKRLRQAVAEEAYEEAARLRDRLNAIP